MRDGEADSNSMFETCTDDANPSRVGFNGCFRLSVQPLTQSFLSYQPAPAHADCGQVFMLYRVVEEPKRKASHLSGLPRSIRHSRQIAVHVSFPFLAGCPPSFPNHSPRTRSHKNMLLYI